MKRASTLFAAGALATCAPAAPSDQAMIETFHRNRAQFEKLRETVCDLSHAQVVMMDPEWSRPMVSEQERQPYYAIFRAIGAKGIQATPEPCQMWIEVWSVGLGGDGDYKKYRFGPEIHTPMINSKSLDTVDRSSNQSAFYQRHIDGEWWLEFHHWP